MKTLYILLILFLGTSRSMFGQVVTFLVQDKVTNLPLEDVQVFSHEKHDKVVFTSKEGYAKFDISKTDTMVFFKQMYSPEYLTVSHSRQDSIHKVIKVMMSPSNATANRSTSSGYQISGAPIYESKDSISTNIKEAHLGESAKAIPKGPSFHIVDVQIGKKPSGKRTQSSIK